jgi:hypothetical protein
MFNLQERSADSFGTQYINLVIKEISGKNIQLFT